MPMVRCNSEIPVPPPSPIPTGRGTRSAANDIFSQFLEKTIHLPQLTLPEPPHHHYPPAPVEIDLRSLPLIAADSLVRSAREFGAFRIRYHGISGNELRRIVDEAENVFQDWKRVVVERNERSGEMIPIVRSKKGALEFTAIKILGNQSQHRNFWVHMGNVASRLDSIVEQVSLVLQRDTSPEFKKRIDDTESVMCLCRYPHNNVSKQDEGESDEKRETSSDHALRFYLPMEHCIFYLQTERGPLSFDAGPENIVVTIGKQLEEWSQGVFKCVPGEMIFMPNFQSSQASFSIELMFSATSNLIHNSNISDQIISIKDQILIVFCLAFLYKFLYFIFS
ncbi:putative isopenicillin N synthase [Lupinus albus]|uniref:Putative isopenicillin N synthase n=1 Tax=Lupinus albus TaxID=3870 RepID=A0A6A4NVZ0_LUPAL|nr:putative isopenicillin N synthase [Lupinus albus]